MNKHDRQELVSELFLTKEDGRLKEEYYVVAYPQEISFFTNITHHEILEFCKEKIASNFETHNITDYYFDTDDYALYKNGSSLRLRVFEMKKGVSSEIHAIFICWNKKSKVEGLLANQGRKDEVYVQVRKYKKAVSIKEIISQYESNGYKHIYTLSKTKNSFNLIPMRNMTSDEKGKLPTEVLHNWEYHNMGLKVLVDLLNQNYFGYQTAIEIEFNGEYLGQALKYSQMFKDFYKEKLEYKLLHKIEYLLEKDRL